MTNVRKALFDRLLDFLPAFIALVAAFAVASLLLLSLNANPATAVVALWQGAFGSENATAETLVKATPILFVAIGITIAFRGGIINIGGEGQMIIGALAGTAVALPLGQSTSFWIAVPATLITGFVAGGLYGGLAGYLKAYFDVNEILSTIMLNQVAVQMMNYLLSGVMLDPADVDSHIPKTARLEAAAQIPRMFIPLPGEAALFDRTRLHYGLLIGVVLAILVYIFLWRTSLGYRIRMVGKNARASRYAGIGVERQTVFAMFLAGGCAGLAGVVQVMGLQYRLQTDGSPLGFTGNAGFNGIVAALFGGLNPIGAIPASAFFGSLLVGAQRMQRELGVNASLITTINGLIVVFVVSSQIWVRQRAKRRASGPPDQRPQQTAGESPLLTTDTSTNTAPAGGTD
jgi:general nucleoside transport system permease protein